MKIRRLRKSEIKKFSELASFIISNVDYDNKDVAEQEAEKYSFVAVKRLFNNKDNIYLVCENKNNLLGFCYGYSYKGVFWIDWIGVNKGHRRKNIGLKLLSSIEVEAKKNGVHKVSGATRINNKNSINMLKKSGYKKIANLKKYWYKEDFYMWEKFL